MQYQSVTLSHDETTRFTTGLQNHDRTVGLTYAFGNHYAGGAAGVTPGRAITFLPVVSEAQGSLEGMVRNSSAGGAPIPDAVVTFVGGNRALTTGTDGRFWGSAPIGTWDLAVAHASCPPDTLRDVAIVTDETTNVSFDLADIAGPAFTGTTVLESTPDAAGPYVVESVISDISGVSAQTLHYTSSTSGGPFAVPLTLIDAAAGRYRAEIPGQALGSRVQYWLVATDVLDLDGDDPVGAPWPCYTFQVQDIAELSDEDFESGTAGWQVNLDGNDDPQSGAWVLVDPVGTTSSTGNPVQPEDDHTPTPGVTCWVTGQHVSGQSVGYADLDGGPTTLSSPVWNVAGYSRVDVSYWRWFSNDAGSNPGEDPWVVEVSNDGGSSWSTVENTTDSDASWQQVNFELSDYFASPGQLRLRFVAIDAGSGSLVEAAVDDVRVSAVITTPDVSAPTVTLTNPDGGESYGTGQTLPIAWNASDDVGVVEARISLSLDSGSSWGEPILQGAYNGNAQWVVDTPMGSTHARLRVEVLDSEGRVASDMSSADFTITVDVTPAPLPAAVQLAQNHPNPFNPQTVIAFSLPQAQDVSLCVYDVHGRLVRTLVAGEQAAGSHAVTWRGLDDAGQTVASGMYFYRLRSDEGVQVRKMMMLK